MKCGACCAGEPERMEVVDEVFHHEVWSAPTAEMVTILSAAEDTQAVYKPQDVKLDEEAAAKTAVESEVQGQPPIELPALKTKQEEQNDKHIDANGKELNNAEAPSAPMEGPEAAASQAATNKQQDYYTQNSERSQEPHHSENQQPPKNVLQAVLYRSSEPDDAQFMGVRIRDGAISENPMAKPENLEELLQGFVRTLKRLPGHFARELLLVFPPVLAGVAYMTSMGFMNRVFRKAIPDHVGSLKELEFRTGEMGLGLATIGCVGSFTFILSLAICFGIIGVVLWRVRVVNAWLKFYPAWVIFNVAILIGKTLIMAKSDRPDFIDRMVFLTNFATLLVAMIGQMYFVGKANDNPFFWKMLAFLFGTVAGNYYLYRNIMQRILMQSDIFKILFCGIVNPLAAQLFQLLPARMAGRSFHHNDPSTSWVLVQVCLVFEKAYSRLVIASMQSTALVGIASLSSTVGSGLMLLSVGKEDVRVYRLLGWITGRKDACANIQCARNMGFRTSIYCFDFCCELTMILAFGCFYLAYDVQRADGTRPEAAAVIPAVLTQLLLQLGANTVQIFIVTLKQGVDYVVLARWRCKWWSLITIPCMIFPLSMMCASMFVQLLCAAPEDGDTHWVICGTK